MLDEERLVRAVLRTDFCAFLHKVFKTINPAHPFVDNWHYQALAWRLGQVERGRIKRLLITQPPRSLKSITTSVAWVAWCLGHHPGRSFLCISYSQDLALDLARKFKLVAQSQWYRALFPGTRFTRMTDTECATTKGGERITTSIGGTLTGRGADVVIIDDPLKAEDAASVIARTTVLDWYRGTLMSRLNDQKRGAILVVMQRLHEEDLAGYLLRKEMDDCTATKKSVPGTRRQRAGHWTHLNLPVMALGYERIPIGRGCYHTRKVGDLLHPAREGTKELDRLKQAMGSARFSAQYLQRPIPMEGNLVKRAWFTPYSRTEMDDLKDQGYARIVQSWDVATSTADTADWSVCTTWLRVGEQHYLVDVLRRRVSYPQLRHQIISQAETWHALTILIEENGIGKPLLQDLFNAPPVGMVQPIGMQAKDGKVMRMEAQSAIIENAQVHLPKDALWLDGYLHEVLAFPMGRHDDQVDSTSQYLKWATQYDQPSDWGGRTIELIR